MIISLIKGKFTQAISKRINIFEISAFEYFYFGNQNPRTFRWYIKISSAEIFEFVNYYPFPAVISSGSSDVTY